MRNSVQSFCLISSLVASVAAQGYTTNFETLTASTGGTPSAGQDGFYTPPIASSFDGAIFTYAGNTLGIPTNANGGAKFYAGVNSAGLVRTQRNVTPPSNSRCVLQFDALVNFNGTGTPTIYPGGISMQPSAVVNPQFPVAAVYLNVLAGWTVATATPLTWDVYVAYGPTAASAITLVPDPAFQNLAVNVWHNFSLTFDLRNKEYVSWTITNGVTNVTTTYTPPTPVPLPNQASVQLPTDFRFFTGGGVGNVFAVDNFAITYGATYDTFGAGCAGSMGVPTLAAVSGSVPRLGTTFQGQLGNLPLSLAVITTGFSNTLALGSVPLPFNLASNGFPGCNLLVDPLVSQFLVGASNTATWTFTIPLSSSFAGVQVFNQGVSLDSAPPGASFTNAGRAVVGR